MRRSGSLAAAAALMLALSSGCTPDVGNRARLELIDARDRIRKLEEENRDLADRLAASRREAKTLRRLGPKRMDKLFHVRKLAIGRYTAGADLDGKGAQDGVKVYLQLFDQHGSKIKAAGDVTVQLYDLSATPKRNLIGQCAWTVEQVNKQWAGGLISYHYVLPCRWRRPPSRDEVTVRVEFVDYLTGKTFVAQRVVTVKVPAATQPAR